MAARSTGSSAARDATWLMHSDALPRRASFVNSGLATRTRCDEADFLAPLNKNVMLNAQRFPGGFR